MPLQEEVQKSKREGRDWERKRPEKKASWRTEAIWR